MHLVTDDAVSGNKTAELIDEQISGSQSDTEGVTDNNSNEDLKTVPSDTSNLYSDVTKGVFKTSDRLIDDIKQDLLFLLSEAHDLDKELANGILKLPGIRYSKQIESTNRNPFELYILDQDSRDIETVESRDSQSSDKETVKIIRAILYDNSQATLSKLQVYHVKISIKEKTVTDYQRNYKHEFHLIDKLNEQDTVDLSPETLLPEDGDPSLKLALPKILDEANYVCAVTNKVLRIVISEPEFNHADLNDFEIGPINVRYNKALIKYPNLRKDIPSPAECLYTLYRVIKGALLMPIDDNKTISAGADIESRINPDILYKKLHFKSAPNQYIPPKIADIKVNEQEITRESYLRKRLEVVLLGTKAHSGIRKNPFVGFHFTNSTKIIFSLLGDLGSAQAFKTTKDLDLINLAAYSFYPTELIIACYQKAIAFDIDNRPIYFDNLKAIYQKFCKTSKLKQFIDAQESQNVIGQKEINDAYKTLCIDAEQGRLLSDDLLLTMYKTEADSNLRNENLRNAIRTLGLARGSDIISNYLTYEPMPLDDAYNLLNIDANVDDDIVQTAVMVKKTDSPKEEGKVNRALITIAIARASSELLYSFEHQFKDFNKPISFLDACEYLGVDPNASEFQIITIFQAGNRELKAARNALRVIGQTKKSKVIDTFLRTGMIDHNLLPAENWPVGLNNIGNTCYLNSLLQYYFSIKPFRDEVLKFKDTYHGQEIYQNRRIGGRLVQEREIERSFQFTYQLRDLFFEQIHSNERCITPKKELAYLAFLPSVADVEFKKEYKYYELTETPPQTELDIMDVDDQDAVNITSEINSKNIQLDDDLKLSSCDEISDKENNNPFNTEVEDDYEVLDIDEFDENKENRINEEEVKSTLSDSIVEVKVHMEPIITSKALKVQETEMETAYEIGRQQDVTECIGNVLSQIEAAFKPEGFDETDKEQNDLVKRLFFGKTIQHLTGLNDPTVKRDKTDRFSNLFVNIVDKPRNLYEAFDFFYKNEEVTIDSGVFNRSERIIELPIILQIQISRVYFDRVRLCPYKNTDQLPFPETLYMDRYLDTDDPEIISKHAKVEIWKNEIVQLKERREKLLTKDGHDVTFRDSIKATKEWLESENLATPDTLNVLSQQLQKIDDELVDIYNKINQLESKIDHQFDSFQKHGYSIFAIFIHRGEANYGHYWIYIKDKKNNMYRKYNDEIVSEVTLQEVFNFDSGNTATPYFLAYIRNGHEDEIEPLFRASDSK